MSTPHKPKSLKPLIALNALLMIGVILVICFTMGVFGLQSVPKTLPAFGMESLEGKSFDSADMTDNVMVVNVFASWCTPCLAEHPLLMKIANSGIVPLYGIALQDKPEDLKLYLEKHGNPFKSVGMDYAGLIPRAVGQSGIPITLIIDQDLTIQWIWMGPITDTVWEEQMLPLINNLGQQDE